MSERRMLYLGGYDYVAADAIRAVIWEPPRRERGRGAFLVHIGDHVRVFDPESPAVRILLDWCAEEAAK